MLFDPRSIATNDGLLAGSVAHVLDLPLNRATWGPDAGSAATPSPAIAEPRALFSLSDDAMTLDAWNAFLLRVLGDTKNEFLASP
jgi:hypothetical protein